ncbi:MAG: hypothetical protein U0U25_03770 [Flavobacteriales bacterium]
MGNLYYEASNCMYFQQAEQPVKWLVLGNTPVLEVNAMMNVRADSYLAIFHVTQLGQTAEEADSLLDARMRRMSARLWKEGLRDEDIFLDMLSFLPVYEVEATRKLFSTTYQEVPAGFEIREEHPHPLQRCAHTGQAGERRREGGDLRPGEGGLLRA